MTTDQEKIKMAKDTFDELCKLLLPNTVCPLDVVPCKLLKSNPKRFHMRIRPFEQKPVYFWIKATCFYEILVGPSEEKPGSVGSVQFYRAGKRAVYQGKDYSTQVLDILKSAEHVAPRGFNLGEPDKKRTFFNFERHYYGNTFPCETAATDLAWLIGTTLPKFQSIHEN